MDPLIKSSCSTACLLTSPSNCPTSFIPARFSLRAQHCARPGVHPVPLAHTILGPSMGWEPSMGWVETPSRDGCAGIPRDKKAVHRAPMRSGPHAGAASTALHPGHAIEAASDNLHAIWRWSSSKDVSLRLKVRPKRDSALVPLISRIPNAAMRSCAVRAFTPSSAAIIPAETNGQASTRSISAGSLECLRRPASLRSNRRRARSPAVVVLDPLPGPERDRLKEGHPPRPWVSSAPAFARQLAQSQNEARQMVPRLAPRSKQSQNDACSKPGPAPRSRSMDTQAS